MRRPALRIAALLLAGTAGVHELRYRLAFGSEAHAVIAHYGHGYLSFVLPLVGFLTALALAQVVTGAVRGACSPAVVFGRTWPAATAALLALYLSQEVLEGALSVGHPAGASGALADGGWLAAPLSVAFGALVALGLRAARAIERAVAGGRVRLAVVLTPAAIIPPAHCVFAVRGASLAEHLAGRAPPHPSA